MGRRLVIDSSSMQSAELADFLSCDRGEAVLTDYVWTECYKQGSLSAVRNFLSVVRSFPERLIMLRSTHSIAGVDPRLAPLPSSFEWSRSDYDLETMLQMVDQLHVGDVALPDELEHRWTDAERSLKGMMEGAVDIIQSLPEIAAIFTPDEQKRYRTGSTCTATMTEKVFGAALQICEALIDADGRMSMPPPRFLTRTFYYRFALGVVLHCIWWIRSGSQPIKRPDRLRNDYIDLGIAVCASYYDGMLTGDAKATWLYNELINALAFAEREALKF